MARGPAPKPATQRRRRNATPGARTLKAVEGGASEIPPLPARGRGSPAWHPQVTAWWNDSWASPMAAEWLEADYHGMAILAQLEQAFWLCPLTDIMRLKELAGEIRLQRQQFGLTPLDRQRLRWEIERGESAVDATTRRRQAAKGTTSGRGDPRLKAI